MSDLAIASAKESPNGGSGLSCYHLHLDEAMSEEDTSKDKEVSPVDLPPHHGAEARAHQPHTAHHLKFGDIAVSGFAPPSIDGNEDSDADDPCHHSSDREQRRRKMTRDRSMEALDAEARRIHAQRRYLVRRPRALQYFRGSTLVRSDEERSSDRLELFFDLTFVGIIAVLAEEAVREPTGPSVVRYIITYTAAYTIWSMMKEASNAFHNHDLTQKMTLLFVMACLVIYGNNAPQVQQNLSQGSARAAAVSSYLLAEFALVATSFYYSFHIKAYRAQLRIHAGLWLITSGIWIGCIFVDVRSAIAMAFVAIALEMAAWHFAYSLVLKKMLRLRYSSALNLEHQCERINDFFTLVIGEFIFSLFSGSPVGQGVHIAAARAVLAVVIAFCFQLLYMQGGGSKQITHPLRRSWWRGATFFSLHIPVVSALTLCGDSMAEFVQKEHVSQSLRWIACETYAIGMIGIWSLAVIEYERDGKGELWQPKWLRLTPRLLIGIVAIFLPFTPQKAEEGGSMPEAVRLIRRQMEGSEPSLGEGREDTGGMDITTTKLLAILACMSFFALIWELVTSLDGPNAEQETASDEFLNKANDGHTTRAALSTRPWRGYPALVEPGAGTFDLTHQRDHHAHVEDHPSS